MLSGNSQSVSSTTAVTTNTFLSQKLLETSSSTTTSSSIRFDEIQLESSAGITLQRNNLEVEDDQNKGSDQSDIDGMASNVSATTAESVNSPATSPVVPDFFNPVSTKKSPVAIHGSKHKREQPNFDTPTQVLS